jgi:hypothetical protein
MQGNRGRIRQKRWYEHVPKSVEASRGGEVTILWNQQIQTDRTIPNNKPDIVIRDYEKGTCMLLDVAIPGDRNVIQKEAEKILKYKGLTIYMILYVYKFVNNPYPRRRRRRSNLGEKCALWAGKCGTYLLHGAESFLRS